MNHMHRMGSWIPLLGAAMLQAAEPGPVTPAARWVTGALQSPFTEESALRGLNYATADSGLYGDGALFADLDDDGDPDVVAVGRLNGMVGVFENNGNGFFIDRSAASGLPLMDYPTGVIAGDYDRDGDLDLYFTAGYDTKNPSKPPNLITPNVLARNDGNWQFVEVTVAAGVVDDGPGYGSAWGDYDGDGWLDLYVSNRYLQNRLFRNLGDGTFEELAERLGVDRGIDPTFQSAFLDYDRDGDLDLYVGNDKGDCVTFWNHLFKNEGGSFVEVTEEAGAEACVWSMCIAIGDFDNNRFDDLYVTNLPPGNALLMNNGAGSFTHQENAAGVASFVTGWGAVFLDYDNDGYLDLYVCNSHAPNRLYHHTGIWPCQDVSDILSVADGGESYVVSAADIEGDGDLDLMVQNANDSIRLYINHEGQKRSWARFDVRGIGPLRHAIGAIVDVRIGSTWRTRQVVAGCNYLTQNELVLHFGLGDAVIMDEVRIQWPGMVMRTLLNLPTHQKWTLYPTDKLGDGDHDGDQDLDDFVLYSACHNAAIQPGCEMMDFDGNAIIDNADFNALVEVLQPPPGDCDNDGQLDIAEILADGNLDQNGDGAKDSCECLYDLDGDNTITAGDLAQLLGAWGPNPGHPADFNQDAVVNAADLATLLGAWNLCN